LLGLAALLAAHALVRNGLIDWDRSNVLLQSVKWLCWSAIPLLVSGMSLFVVGVILARRNTD
ncbi:MAG TPA: hypothetical protein VGX76_07460, partial [Pirellulales bacterium]|nr:hypothetical protein [Pirellulales bacterium]